MYLKCVTQRTHTVSCESAELYNNHNDHSQNIPILPKGAQRGTVTSNPHSPPPQTLSLR